MQQTDWNRLTCLAGPDPRFVPADLLSGSSSRRSRTAYSFRSKTWLTGGEVVRDQRCRHDLDERGVGMAQCTKALDVGVGNGGGLVGRFQPELDHRARLLG